ncbi:MAG: hypothetical protein BJ554DRAFT_4819 [Olpidium bornovanus]|uniref:HTH APSES-type domain-containing protein n=1 Tax=Olpidium bornovanus TaxID=278681 RepID=A0A8H8A0P4_9FUNG|nr:MAG: hypothetical protein BJ554DRAFT_4819 [Olpidium bornovanus]
MPAYNGAEVSPAPSRTGHSDLVEAEVDGEYPLPRKQSGLNHFRRQDSRGKSADEQSQPSTTIYAATYSGVPVYEMMSRGIAVMRRKSDSYLNATQILKVAGIEKGRRTKILEKEVLQGEHEKVQGGYGKYQGTWVPYKRGLELAEQYAVDHFLRPLFLYNPHADGSLTDNTPTKEQLRTKDSTGPAVNTLGEPRLDGVFPVERNFAAHMYFLPEFPAVADTADHGNRKRRRTEDGFSGVTPSFVEPEPSLSTFEVAPVEEPPCPAPPPKQLNPDADKHRAMLMAMFLNEDPNHVPDILVGDAMPPDLDIDMVIDDQGHTAVHWAAALSRIGVLRLLVKKGADVNRVNYTGETALERAVLVTNNYDTQSFPQLLDILQDSIPVRDKKNRTVLHHIVLTAGIKGRATSANYYMACLLEWTAQNGRNVSEIVDVQEKNGDTALNVAARIGNQALIAKLVEVGASRYIENKVGLKPEDFGVEGKPGDADDVSMFNPSIVSRAQWLTSIRSGVAKGRKRDLDDKENISELSAGGYNGNINKRGRDLINGKPALGAIASCRRARRLLTASSFLPPPLALFVLCSAVEAIMNNVEKKYEAELSGRKEELTKTQQNLRSSTRELAVLRREVDALEAKHDLFADVRNRKAALEQAVKEEDEETRQLLAAGAIPADVVATDTVASDAAERVPSVTSQPPSSAFPPPATAIEDAAAGTPTGISPTPRASGGEQSLMNEVRALRARVDAYQHNSVELRSKISLLETSAAERETKCKRLIATCCNLPIDAVDSMLPQLMQAVDADGSDINLSRVAGFMSCVKQQEGVTVFSPQ